MLARAAAVAWFCMFAGFSTIVEASDSFPYRAYIASDDVNVRSGPGDNYYPVMKLARGDVVEVYRHDPGGWYAIRPPAGSFSWVSGEFLKPGAGGKATVIGDRVVARVGSSFSDIRDVIQVRLDRGEEIEVLEAKRIATGPAAQTWYKIAPPPGEFRWVSGKFVERELNTAAPRTRGPENNL
ncbi:MAG TPA: SH3 domain-containing protein, partial [Pirellulales bacterium]|nr:SH3 domain-containing protein [Pirellulales bacterium]